MVAVEKDKDRKQGNMAAIGLIVLATAWANFHGGTLPILFALTGLQLVAEIFPSFVTGNVKHEKKDAQGVSPQFWWAKFWRDASIRMA